MTTDTEQGDGITSRRFVDHNNFFARAFIRSESHQRFTPVTDENCVLEEHRRGNKVMKKASTDFPFNKIYDYSLLCRFRVHLCMYDIALGMWSWRVETWRRAEGERRYHFLSSRPFFDILCVSESQVVFHGVGTAFFSRSKAKFRLNSVGDSVGLLILSSDVQENVFTLYTSVESRRLRASWCLIPYRVVTLRVPPASETDPSNNMVHMHVSLACSTYSSVFARAHVLMVRLP